MGFCTKRAGLVKQKKTAVSGFLLVDKKARECACLKGENCTHPVLLKDKYC